MAELARAEAIATKGALFQREQRRQVGAAGRSQAQAGLLAGRWHRTAG